MSFVAVVPFMRLPFSPVWLFPFYIPSLLSLAVLTVLTPSEGHSINAWHRTAEFFWGVRLVVIRGSGG